MIGGQNVAIGDHVTFWGAQWWQDNTLSGGLAPAAFKGFVTAQPATAATRGRPTPVVTITVDPGYAGDPGHPGTGEASGIMCGGILAG